MALWQWQHVRSKTAANVQLEPVSFADLVGWDDDSQSAALQAFLKSVGYFRPELAPEAEAAAHESSDASARRFFQTHFHPHRVVPTSGERLLTGYFEPELEGALKPSANYTVPIYRRPHDLELASPEDKIAKSEPPFTAGRRRADGLLEPYYTRGEIEDGALSGRGLEIAYAADAVDLFVMHVQGSGLLRLPDGSSRRLTFAGKNGHPYTSIAKLLIARGELVPEKATLDDLLHWLRADQLAGRALMRENKSYIFFDFLPEADSLQAGTEAREGPRGSLGVPLTPGRSLAADPAYHTPGVPVWVEAPAFETQGGGLRRLMIMQDTGSAITGAVRGDIFWGTGAMAGSIAGRTKHECNFFVLLPKT